MILRAFFLFLFAVTFSNLSFGQKQDYLWPTDASQHLTSTFGETRSAHFHSGLDIKTWGREGYKVFASKDGIVYRLAISVEGYGKVIYLKHNDGSFTVYAHLQRFNDTLQAYIDSVRMQDYSFETDVIVENLDMKVSQGDVIGFTGSTGVGPPHLHFEIRDSEDNPINALRSNLKVEDTIAPTISAMLVFPISPEATIRGSKFPQLYYPSKDDSGNVNFGTIEANGPIGITVSNFDEANGVTNKYATYELGLLQGEDTLFFERLDEFTFKEDDVMFTDRIPSMGASRRSYQTLFKKDGPENPFYIKVTPKSILTPDDSNRVYRIITNDFYGNHTSAEFSVKKSRDNISSGTYQPEFMHEWFWTEDWFHNGLETIYLKNPDFGTTWIPERNQRILFDGEKQIMWGRITPSDPYKLNTTDQNLSLYFPRDTFFDTLSIASYTGLMDGYPYINIQPGMIPARKEFKIEFYLGNDFLAGNEYQLFRVDRTRDRITYVDSKLIGRTVHGYPSNLGEFIIMPDNDPPVLQTPKIIRTEFGKWLIHISAEDALSGINFRDSNAYVNGERGILEYDNEEDLLIYYHPEFIPKKENIITLTVFDKAGNKITQSFKVNQM